MGHTLQNAASLNSNLDLGFNTSKLIFGLRLILILLIFIKKQNSQPAIQKLNKNQPTLFCTKSVHSTVISQ